MDCKMSTSTTRSLLDLPAELRLRIYDYFIPESPLKVPPEEFSSLLYSCKLIRQELEPELCKVIAQSVHQVASDIRQDGYEIEYTPPTTLDGWLNLRVSRPKVKKMFYFLDPFSRFRYFRFNTFTLAFHNDAEGYEPLAGRQGPPVTYQITARYLATRMCSWAKFENTLAMKRWILDWSAYPSPDSDITSEVMNRIKSSKTWGAERLMDDAGNLTGMRFFRKIGMGT